MNVDGDKQTMQQRSMINSGSSSIGSNCPVDFSTSGNIVIRGESLWKQYRLGTINHGTLANDLQSWWARSRGRTDPNRKLDHEAGKAHSSTFWALKDVSFDVNQGEVLGIIGRNGAGKSTLLKILSKVTTPTKGLLKVRGRIASLLEVGTGFHPELTGRENIFLNGAILGMDKHEIRRKLDEIIAFAEVDKFIDTPVKRYSSGMYVRLAFAVAAHLEPEILIVDEVLAVGDTQFQKKCIGKIGDVSKAGQTVLFVSHNMAAVQNLCQRILLLDCGQIVFSGETSTGIKNYLNISSLVGEEKSPGVFELSDRTNPYGQELLVKRLSLSGECGPQSDVEMGKVCNIDIDVSGLSVLQSADIGIIIKDKYGKWVTGVNSGMLGGLSHCTRSLQERITFSIETLRLTADTYFLDVSVAQKGIGRIDYVENAAKFKVISSDVYGTGHELTSYFGYFYLEAKLTLLNIDN